MNQLQIIEHQNQRVLTTKQLSDVYETSVENINKNFQRNRERFDERRDYHIVKGEELKQLKNNPTISPLVGKNANQLILWTERGANRHSKILDTDKAWQQFDVLEETYFKVKTMTPMQMLKLQNQTLVEVDERVTTVETDVKNLKENKLLNPEVNIII